MKKIIVTITVCLTVFAACSMPSRKTERDLNHYRIDLNLVPSDKLIESRIYLEFHSREDNLKDIVFYLHKQFNIREVTGRLVSGFHFNREGKSPASYLPEGRPVKIQFSRPLRKEESTTLHFIYDGTITEWPSWSANIISEDWVEIGLYLPWFPYNAEYGDFTFEAKVKIDPAFQVCSYGQAKRSGPVWTVLSDDQTDDIIIIASKRLKSHTLHKKDLLINVHYVTLQNSTAKQMGEDLHAAMTIFKSWFGDNKSKAISLVESVRERGGGYARRGLIVLGGLDDQMYTEKREAYIHYLSHEVAHIWWRGASTVNWEDWMNEGFAEYSALLVVREMFGRESFERRLSGKLEGIQNIPPIWDFNRNDRSTPKKREEIEKILYSKGPVLLYELEEKIGKVKFLEFCRRLVANNITSTEGLLKILGNLEGDEVKIWFEILLKTR